MFEKLKKYLHRINFIPEYSSFSQTGEDRIIYMLAKIIKLKDIYYLDIGASHPINMNNTYYLNLLGNKGVCVDANPLIVEHLKKVRPNDISLNYGVCGNQQCGSTQEFYILPSGTLSTFSKDRQVNTGYKIKSLTNVEMISINRLIKEYCKRVPNIISIDVEGMDEEVIKSIDFEMYKPEIFCIETLSYGDKQTKDFNLISFMIEKGYIVFSDTYINTIFVCKDKFEEFRSYSPLTIYS